MIQTVRQVKDRWKEFFLIKKNHSDFIKQSWMYAKHLSYAIRNTLLLKYYKWVYYTAAINFKVLYHWMAYGCAEF